MRPSLRGSPGFTLIEVMVVLVVMGVLATGIGVSLAALQGRDVERAIDRLRLVLEAASERAAVRGQPIAVEFLGDGYRFSVFDTDGRWRPLNDPPVFTEKLLPEGVVRRRLSIEGEDRNAEPRLVFGSASPEFRLSFDTASGPVELVGRATGVVERIRAAAPG